MTIYIVSKQGVELNELHSAHQAERDHMGRGCLMQTRLWWPCAPEAIRNC